jgi:hypothetical protein
MNFFEGIFGKKETPAQPTEENFLEDAQSGQSGQAGGLPGYGVTELRFDGHVVIGDVAGGTATEEPPSVAGIEVTELPVIEEVELKPVKEGEEGEEWKKAA